MPLSQQARLGPYEVLSLIGAGGMGEVYRARDTRLERTVAIKVLPEHLSSNPQLRERFEREARAISSFNHPHICALYDVGQQDGIDYLVMEYLEGETLAHRLKKGPLAIEQVLQYAIQIADALDTAHRHSVIHRDLKTSNIMLTRSGATLLDFGLAKVRAAQAEAGVTVLPTKTTPLTSEGTILGTLQYMAPEQLEGREADARTDIFALGAVIYEMATGRKAFEGKSQASLISAIMTGQPPPISTLQSMAPPALDHVVRTCVAKDPEARWQTARDLKSDLEWIATAPNEAKLVPKPAVNSRLWLQGGAMAVVAVLVMVVLSFLYFRQHGHEPRLIKFAVLPPEKTTFAEDVPAVSADGRRLAFTAVSAGQASLWVRDLDSLAARPLAGTEGASGPFWSPDGGSIGFFAEGTLKRIDVARGGQPLTLSDARGWSGAWNKNDVILYNAGQTGLFRIPATGGIPTPVTAFDRRLEGFHGVSPSSFLPDGRHFVYFNWALDPRKRGIYLGDLDSKSSRQILAGEVWYAAYAPPGYLLFARGGRLMAQPFDAGKGQTDGDPVSLAEITLNLHAPARICSSEGVLVYASSPGEAQLTWFDRSGRPTGTVGAPVPRGSPTEDAIGPVLSPDGEVVAVTRPDGIWLHDLKRDAESRFTFGPLNGSPVWSPDGRHIAFCSERDGAFNVYRKATGGNSQEDLLDKGPPNKAPVDWSPDGRYIVEELDGGSKGSDIWVLPMLGNRKSFPYLQTEFNERSGKLSPNTRWMAYVSDESKRREVYVGTFPVPGSKWRVSTNGGRCPIWSRDGKELYFIGADQRMMAVEVKAGAKFDYGGPRPLFDTHTGPDACFDVSRQGHFLIPVPTTDAAAATPLTVVVNWRVGLKK